jgi:hypothetical protein
VEITLGEVHEIQAVIVLIGLRNKRYGKAGHVAYKWGQLSESERERERETERGREGGRGRERERETEREREKP